MTRTSVLLALSLLGCHGGGEDAGPNPGPESGPADLPEAATIVSSPVPRAAVGASGTGSLVFVAAAPGSIAGAARAIVRGQQGDSALVRCGMVASIPRRSLARFGEKLTVSIVDSGGRTADYHVTVKKRPTRVVRTSPLPSRTDVPLNIRISVVFSAPIDSASAAAGIRLWHGGVPGGGRNPPDAGCPGGRVHPGGGPCPLAPTTSCG
jgi:hypothetical protein